MRLGDGNITAGFPPLRQPKPETADPGTVRLGDGNITAGFPPLRQPKPETADPGTVRLGDGNITAGFPPLRQPKPETADPGTVRLGEVASRPSSRRIVRNLDDHSDDGVPRMTNQAETTICRFYQLIPGAPAPRPADRSADGMLPMRGYRYCEAVATASAFGWYIYPPLSFSLVWDGIEIAWTYAGAEDWYPLRGAQFPGFRQLFEQVAPDSVKPLAPPFLAVSREPGVVQIWSGYLARTAPGWALLSRGPANIPRTQGYEHFEGIIESETWFGPLFTNIRLTRTNSPVEFHVRYPLFQVQPLLRECYAASLFEVVGLEEMKRDRLARFRGDDEAQYRSNADAGALRCRYATTQPKEAINAAETVQVPSRRVASSSAVTARDAGCEANTQLDRITTTPSQLSKSGISPK